MALEPGLILNNRYRIVSLLGQGGFGAVYRAWDLNMERPRALKENLDITSEAQRQFKRESQILDTISHPNLPKVIDHFILQGKGQYLVMEFIEGDDLREKLNQTGGSLPESQVIPWITQICDALGYLHTLTPPVIHRDIKPANIKITPQGQAVLVDFGIAKVYDPVLRTTVGARAVTPGYSPPEQYGQGSTDARTDIYALGATLYTLLTGLTPPDSVDIMTGRESPPETVRTINPEASIQVDNAINKAMNLVEHERFGAISEFKDALVGTTGYFTPLEPQFSGTQVAASTTGLERMSTPKPRSRRRWIPWLAGVVVLGIIVLGSYLVMQLRSGPEQEPFVMTTETSPEDGMVMVLIPGGRFEMGSDEGYDNERPVHTASVKDFWMDQTEITNAMYAACVEAGVCQLPEDTDFFNNPALMELPVVYVSWDNARTYCQWVGRELPSEAMWERAARGGLVGERYPWGEKGPVCTLGAFNGAQIAGCGGGPVPVKSFESNGYGLFDMAGNVWEWVQDRYTPYPGGDPNADEAFGGEARVTRGGCFYDDEDDIGNAVRMGVLPDEAVDYIGFRCALIP